MLSNLVSDWTSSASVLSFIVNLLYRLAVTLPVIVVSITLHEFMHAYTAYKLGDSTAYMQGRVTLNPLKHIDPMGLLCLFFVGFGWGKPVPVNERLLPKRWGGILVSLFGPLSNLCLCLFFSLVRGLLFTYLPVTRMWYVELLLEAFITTNAALCIFNLLPIPPLDGFHILKSLLSSPRTLSMWWQYEKYGFVVLMLLSFTGILGRIMSPLINILLNGIYTGIHALFPLAAVLLGTFL